jgi:tRNA 2-(methylsulfanyl)-N6-isopentenyladenosine37 hydroxylase
VSGATTASPAALLAPTPAAWLEAACGHWQALLVDHACCEKKAASTALALMFAYPEHARLGLALARLAREELRHFEQVTRLMERLAVPFARLKPGRYAQGLRAALRTHEPARHRDLLICGAIIEARSCERFRLLAPRLPAPIGDFYGDLERAEARHVDLYWEFALEAAGPGGEAGCAARLAELVAVEAGLVTTPDFQMRFHSGPPAPGAALPG